jgi:hypothetical protein
MWSSTASTLLSFRVSLFGQRCVLRQKGAPGRGYCEGNGSVMVLVTTLLVAMILIVLSLCRHIVYR